MPQTDVTYPVLTEQQWTDLEITLMRTLKHHGDAPSVYLMVDLLTAVGNAMQNAHLVPWETARKFYATFPEKLPPSGEDLPCPFFELEETRPEALLL